MPAFEAADHGNANAALASIFRLGGVARLVWEIVRRREDSIRKGVPWIGINGICCFGCQHLDVVHWELKGCLS